MIQRVLFGERAELARIRREAFGYGMRAAFPSLVATGIWGIVTGVAMVRAGLTEWQAVGMTLLVYAGSAQLAALPLIAADIPIWIVLLTATVINLRFIIFSAALVPYFKRLPLKKRLLLGYVTADFAFAVSVAHWVRMPGEERGTTQQLWFLVGVTSCTWLVWQTSSIAGIALGAQVPTTWGLDFLPIVSMLALVVPMITSSPTLVGALVSAVVAVLASGLPLRLGLLAAVVVGIAAAVVADIALERKEAT